MQYQIDQLTLDTDRFELTRGGERLHAEPRVIELIVLLVENRERMVPKEEILKTLWHDRMVSESALSSCVKAARKLFNDDGRKQHSIRTIHKKGFRFVAAIDSTSGKESGLPTRVETDTKRYQSRPSIAVLPFSNPSGDPEQDFFCDGVTDDITTLLSQFRDLFVIARNSSFSSRHGDVDSGRIADDLGARYVLEGRVRRVGRRIRVNVQLLDSDSSQYVWSERYERESDDIFALQDEITLAIVGNIAPQIEIAEIDRGRKLPSSLLSSYELSLKATVLFHDGARTGDLELFRQAIGFAREALAIDPRNSHALWIEAYSYIYLYIYRGDYNPRQDLKYAAEIAERFIQVDSANPKAYIVRALIFTLTGEHDAAIADYYKALELNPNVARNLFLIAWGESLAGLTQASRQHAEQALRLSPRDDDNWRGEGYLALTQACFAEGDFEASRKWAETAIQVGTKAPMRRTFLIACLAHLNDTVNLVQNKQALEAISPDFVPSLLRGDMTLFKLPEHNELLISGLLKAGYAPPH